MVLRIDKRSSSHNNNNNIMSNNNNNMLNIVSSCTIFNIPMLMLMLLLLLWNAFHDDMMISTSSTSIVTQVDGYALNLPPPTAVSLRMTSAVHASCRSYRCHERMGHFMALPLSHNDDDDDDDDEGDEVDNGDDCNIIQQQQQQQQQYKQEEKADNDDITTDNVIYYSPNIQLKSKSYSDNDEYNDADEDNAQTVDYDSSTPLGYTLTNKDTLSGGSPTPPETITNEYSFFDEAIIYVRAGSGGQGSSTYQKGPGGQNGLPDGGDGGKGGDVILLVDDSLNTLAGLTRAWRPNAFGGGGGARVMSSSSSSSGGGGMVRPLSFRAENGEDGKRGFKNGRFGKDFVVRVPPGTVVQEEVVEEEEVMMMMNDDEMGEKQIVVKTNLVDLGILGKEEWERKLVVARGGSGGEGSGNQGYKKGRGVRRTRAPPEGGEKKRLRLTLKIVADVALVGVPNAGKSTFLASVTRAKPKIANYPFTTVIPNLGVWVLPYEDYKGNDNSSEQGSSSASEGLAICDVPGLIEGAAEGAGLGHAFLRHVERCHVILHLVDATSNDPIADYLMVNKEIMRYGNGKLAQMPQIVVVNKIDAWEEGSGEEWERGLKTRMDKGSLEASLKQVMPHSRLMWMSAKEKDGVDELMKRMSSFVKKVKAASPE